ncbi:E3 ubiquitin-protein ligase DTX3L-like isoform X2 [Cheilinus undulatus]|uniref:E3 ubiquitin-protein ligase DTX3L-like isoform X2 n=1 Tax=Cheilinus undulatus TaxID=241271 RepID=UPI001BD63743|nr:E3 ubiquitin-protein ligase DTX3L-like isoform X2 [Cheilinus undulatus]
MSGGDAEEMEWTNSDQTSTSNDNCDKDESEAQVTLSIKWSGGPQPKKCKIILEKALQSWSNKNKFKVDCRVSKVYDDGRAAVKITPASALSELQQLCGQKLTIRDERVAVEILYVILSPLASVPQTPDDASLNSCPPSESEPQDEREKVGQQKNGMNGSGCNIPPPLEEQNADNASKAPPPSTWSETQPEKQSSFNRSTAVSTSGEESLMSILAVSPFWYLNHIYKEEIKHIETKNDVRMSANVHVTFIKEKKNGSPEDAVSDFEALVQDFMKNEFEGADISLKNRDPKQLIEVLKVVQNKDRKLLLTLSSEEMIINGPSSSVEAVDKFLNTMTVMNMHDEESTVTSRDESSGASIDATVNITINIEEPLLESGLIIEEDSWKRIETSFSKKKSKIEDKFGVGFSASSNSKDHVKVKAHYRGLGENASMQSHALRALLRLYQKTATSLLNYNQPHGAAGFSDSPMNPNEELYTSDEDSSEPNRNRKPGYNIHYNDAPKTEGATAGDNKEEKCPICLDSFTKKQQLKCKHEFCEECLEQAKANQGPICPVCKNVFGKVEGNQPDGEMTWRSTGPSLPGFSNCGTITITYNIPSGRQTEKHPNPGQPYHGINRRAYLPDNKEGKEVLQLLKKAFDQKLIFTVGTSRTTGYENQVTWNDIHHKTSTTGGAQGFGYPDPDYLRRVREELKANGIE